VTGGASGIGAACARTLATRGATVVVADLSEAEAAAVADTLPGGLGVHVDVGEPSSVSAMVARAVAAYGRLDVAVNNAGVGVPVRLPVAEMHLRDWRRVMTVNLDGVFHCLQAEIPAMLASGGGAVVNIASVMGAVGTTGAAAYVAAKHGVVGLTRAAALEYAGQGIRVNCVGPGFVDTPLLQHHDAADRERIAQLHPLGRLGTAEEIAAVVAFLSSPAAAFVTGAYYLADGGYTAQ
jgi:NAD(P)-dependent dehydrogenase (short-subunit alcohol dehydrogenase family)